MNRLTLKIEPAVTSRASEAFLPTESRDSYEFSLPCPSVALLGLALACSSPTDRTDKLQRVLRLNPALLLFALARYRSFNQTAAASADQLVAWCAENLMSSMLEDDFGSAKKISTDFLASTKTRQKLRRALDQFLRARSYSDCLSSLNEWLKIHWPKDARQAGWNDLRKRWLKHILEKSFRLDGFRAYHLRKKSTLNATLLQWTQPSQLTDQVKPFFKLAATSCQITTDYQHQLETEKLAAMKQLAYGASHEINNPLANIATRAQTMLGDETHPEKRSKLATIYQQAMRAHEMISDMMLFAHPPATCMSTVSIRQVMRRFIGQQENCLPQDDETIETRVFIGPNFDRVCLDPTQLLVVLQMLVRNSKEAIRATKDATGEIKIRAELVDRTAFGLPRRLQLGSVAQFLQISVQDNGIGVDARVRRHLFDPFFSGREAGRGLGFGLSKTWRIVQQHDGEIIFDETEPVGQGARFVLWLPQPA